MFLTSVVSHLFSLKFSKSRGNANNLTYSLNEATVVDVIGPPKAGKVMIHGVYWKAKATKGLSNEIILVGKTVVVDYRKGLTLYVHPTD